MRADRLVQLVLLLRQRGQMTAKALASELEVTTRTVLRDIEALSAAGVPVYAERGRHGGFALLPGFGTELTGLSHDEALALVVAGSGRGEQVFGLGSALTSAVRKVLDALPESHRTMASDAARRLLLDPDSDLIAQPKEQPSAAVAEVRRAVLAGTKLRIRYAAEGRPPVWRTVDPIGLVDVRDRQYLIAARDGAERTYRLSRVIDAEGLEERAERPRDVDLDTVWRERCAQYLHGGDQVTATVRVEAERRDELASTALAVRASGPDVEVTFQDAEHAEFALWRLAEHAEALEPEWLRAELRARATAVATRYEKSSSEGVGSGRASS